MPPSFLLGHWENSSRGDRLMPAAEFMCLSVKQSFKEDAISAVIIMMKLSPLKRLSSFGQLNNNRR